MAFESFAHVPVTEELLRHVWEGEKDSIKGGHRHGLRREGKTEFPADWDLAMVDASIRAVLSLPESIRVRGPELICFRQVGEVLMKVILRSNSAGLFIFTAYPVSGHGVIINQKGKAIPCPLDLSVLEF
ncbi:hypothetical protein [uncultured Aurantimicrobium sp.]|uniref:hypothetical protein n=1 Tax=uncultured Aurantimicrobium sp. TaxID=1705357 RepID=UPI002622A381|nr:hypothetical protein [uncultured Aurantimicrobium sp.]